MHRHDAELGKETLGNIPRVSTGPEGTLFSPFMARAALVSPLDANLGLPIT